MKGTPSELLMCEHCKAEVRPKQQVYTDADKNLVAYFCCPQCGSVLEEERTKQSEGRDIHVSTLFGFRRHSEVK